MIYVHDLAKDAIAKHILFYSAYLLEWQKIYKGESMKKTIILINLVISYSLLIGQNSPFLTTQIREKEQAILNTLTLDQKIGQLFMVAAVSDEESNKAFIERTPYRVDKDYVSELITTYHIGGIIFLGTGNSKQQIKRTRYFQQLSSIPLLIGQDLEPGLIMNIRLPEIRWPNSMTLGAIQDLNLIYELGKQIGEQCKKLGVHINFAPVIDVNNNPENPVINIRSFGDDARNVTQKAEAFMRGLQDAGVLACGKHFPGHGDTSQDSHDCIPLIQHDKKRLYSIELYPFKELIKDGIASIMIAHLEVPAFEPDKNRPSSLSKNIVTHLLKEELGFDGLIITDGLGMQGVRKYLDPGEIELQALLAGNDILLCPIDVPKSISLIKKAFQNGRLTEKKLDHHVLKILMAKEWIQQHQKVTPDINDTKQLQSDKTQKLKKRLYRHAITLVKNNHNLLPLHGTNQRIPVIQIGGKKDEPFKFHLTSYIPTEVYHMPSDSDAKLIHNLCTAVKDSNTIIVSIHDMTRSPQNNFGIKNSTINLIKTLHDMKKNIILTIFGSPYSITFFDNTDAIIVAYENDTDAQEAAANTIVGKIKANGILPVR